MADIQVGDQIFDEKGQICKVVAISAIQHRRCFELIFDDGSKLIADDVHRWVTLTDHERTEILRRTDERRALRRANRPSRAKLDSKKPWVSALLTERNKNKVHQYLSIPNGEIRNTLEIKNSLFVGAANRSNHSIGLCKPLCFPESELPIDPYTLGVWLGDGISSSGVIGMMVSDLDEIKKYIPYQIQFEKPEKLPLHRKPFSMLKLVGFRKKLKLLELLKNKHIPAIYLHSSIKQRKELLRGILDTDGHANQKGAIELGLSNKRLADDALELINSLGIKASQKVKKTICNDSYITKFMADFPAFKLKRKLKKQKLTNFRDTIRRRYIVDVREIESVPTKCISVDSPSNLYLAGKSFIPTHNTDLLLGITHREHLRSIIFRRENKQLRGIEDRSVELFYRDGHYNRSDKIWRFNDGRIIEFGGVELESDKEKYQGRASDFKGFDEITHFSRTQFEYISTWTRSATPGQRSRIICTGNPPTSAEGDWVIDYWAPWLDEKHPNPAMPGELRWYTSINGREVEVADGKPFEREGQLIYPKSRTFIPANIDDNPYLRESGYKATLQALPKELREKFLEGKFTSSREDNPWQVIPSKWVQLAQQRWRERVKPPIRCSSIGVDVARGGDDRTVLTKRYANWFAPQLIHPGTTTPDGPMVAALVMAELEMGTIANVDVIGVGASVYDHLKIHKLDAYPIQSAEGSDARDRTDQLTFFNKRAEMWWKLREALDPETGDELAIPDSRELLSDLTAPRWELTTRGIKIEPKDKIKERIGRSPDLGDSLVYAHTVPGIEIAYGIF